MDKYTVDLDKVLNDFEYSELTDQYRRDVAGNSAPKAVDRIKATPTKHSITNVFNSLHEYLNTDIDVGVEKNMVNQLITVSSEDTPIINVTSSSTSTETSTIDTIAAIVDSTVTTTAESIIPTVETTISSIGTIINATATITTPELIISTPAAITTTTTTPEPNTPIIDILIEDVKEETVLQDDLQVETEQIEASNEEIDAVEQIEVNETKTEVPDEDLVVKTEEIQKKVVSFDDNIEIAESDVDKYLEELESESFAQNDEREAETIVNDNEIVNNETDEMITNEEVDEIIEETAQCDSNACDETITDEDHEEVESNVHNDIEVEKNEIIECDDEGKTEESDNTLSRPSSLQIENQIDLIGDPGSTPYNNVYVSKELDKGDEETESSTASVSPTFSDVSSGSTRSTATTESVSEIPAGDNSTQNEQTANLSEEQQGGPQAQNYSWLGKQAPLWIPDAEALNCLHCDMKFTVIKRRHHCRACGLVLCSKCCNLRFKLDYLETEARICVRCHGLLSTDTANSNNSSGSEASPSRPSYHPHPNHPMEYCSIVPPLQQIHNNNNNPPAVMVPVGVLKRKGSGKSRTNKSVMFCDGIRPGSELTSLDNEINVSRATGSKRSPPPKINKNVPLVDPDTGSFIPSSISSLPPTVTVYKSDVTYTECSNTPSVVEMLKNESLTFALQSNLQVHVKIINMDCCINKWAWCFTTEGMMAVGQDEILILLEMLDGEQTVPKDVFFHLCTIFEDAKKGTSITELGLSIHNAPTLFDSKNHVGFLYIRPSFQCLQNVIVPKEPYLIGILIHRWETPWAKIFPLRLILRLGAEYRYYPSPIISTRDRDSVYVEIGHTIINLLADFRNFSYTLPNIRGLTIHMEEKNTTVTIPSNRYDQVMKCLNNSSDHILAFGGNFSLKADSHLVCIQDTQGSNENTYTTHAINIHNKPRKVTGASFIVFNGALKSTSGLTAKSSIVEDGLMIQIPAEHMVQIRESLRNMKDHTIQCGCVNATSDETVNIVWGTDDTTFNLGVLSSIDGQQLGGVPSIRVHNGKDFVCNSGLRKIRWTEVFIIQNCTDNAHQEVDFSKLAESISKATCQALVKYLDLLASNNFYKIGIRATLHVENVSYSAGGNGIKLPPIYMRSLDNELVPVLHRITSNNLGDGAIVLELIFRILNA